jgi:Ca-activated chloride channel family protein
MENKTSFDWWQWRWFSPSVWENFDWAESWWLYGIILIPVFFLLRWLVVFQFRQKLPVALTEKDIRSDWVSVLRWFPALVFSLALALIFVALARPQSTNERVDQWSEGIDIMLTIDISQSMQIEDFRPNRLNAAKDVATDFVNGRFQDRIGLVVFSGDAYSRAPLTTDYELLNTYIDDINFNLIESRGTAIGSALAVATNRLRESDSKSKVIILLSDGDNTAGNIDPITAAKLAYAYNIRIYTIAIGREGRVPFGKDYFGRTKYVENTLDESVLREIANIGDGKFYRVSNKRALEEVFAEIDQLEKAEIKETRYKDTTDYYRVYLTWAILFFLVWLLTKSTFMANALVD